MNLGENIYKLRTRKNMSQGDLSDALEVSRQSVSKWENNSATPELDKLIKMSQLFGVTLDELTGVTHESQPNTPEQNAPEPKIIYVEKPAFPKISQHTLIGCLLLLGSFFYALILNNSVLGTTEAILLAAPAALCGVFVLFLKYPRFYCGWAGAGAYWLYLYILFHNNWEDQYLLLILGVGLVIAVIVWSVRVHQSGKVHIPVWVWLPGIILLIGAFILLWINVVPPLSIFVTEHSAEALSSGSK